jgi:hypothetical protein
MISETVARQSLKVLQASSLQTPQLVSRNSGHSNRPIAAPTLTGSAKVEAAISAIINIILDAQGNSAISIFAKDAIASVQTGDGDDIINLDVHKVRSISSGKGDDRIFIKTYALNNEDQEQHNKALFGPAAVSSVSTGDGGDTLVIDSHGSVASIYTGDVVDTIAINSGGDARIVHAGNGDDNLAISANRGFADVIRGDAGDDTFDIAARYVTRIFGDDGDDAMRIEAVRSVTGIFGGDGNNIIEVTAPTIHGIVGGKGDDTMVLTNTANSYSHACSWIGDGHDVVRLTVPWPLSASWAGIIYST